jgi:hypothetical protein
MVPFSRDTVPSFRDTVLLLNLESPMEADKGLKRLTVLVFTHSRRTPYSNLLLFCLPKKVTKKGHPRKISGRSAQSASAELIQTRLRLKHELILNASTSFAPLRFSNGVIRFTPMLPALTKVLTVNFRCIKSWHSPSYSCFNIPWLWLSLKTHLMNTKN